MKYFILLLVVIILKQYLSSCKDIFKISYYETKLKIRGVDIDHIKNISLYEVFFK